MNDARARPLITVDELIRLMDAGTAVVLLDVIDEQGAAPEDRPKIPGALSVHLATDFSGTPTATSGRRPLPDVPDLQAKARAWGIGNATPVVVYDNAGSAQAARAWWTLRWAGLTNVRLLDGGYGAWVAAGRPFSTQVAARASRAGNAVLTSGHMPAIRRKPARGTYRAPFMRRPVATSRRENSSRAMICTPASARSAPMAQARSESIAAAATQRRTPSPPWRRLGSTPRSTWDRGRPGAPIQRARSRPEPSQSSTAASERAAATRPLRLSRRSGRNSSRTMIRSS